MSKQLADLSTSEVVAWIKNNIKETPSREKAVKAIEDEDISGKLLLTLTDVEKFKDSGITGPAVKRIMDGLTQSFEDYRPKTTKTAPSADDTAKIVKKYQEELKERKRNNNNSNDSSSFTVSVSIGGGKRKTIGNSKFTVNTTVLQLKRAILDSETGGDPDDLLLKYNRKSLLDNETLGDIGINGVNDLWVVAAYRTRGGAFNDNNNEDKKNSNTRLLDNGKNSDSRRRIPHFNNKNIKPTFEPDCLTYYDSKNDLRVIMPCGHIFSPLTIFKWCQRTLEVLTKTDVCCPIENCGKIWELNDIVDSADLDEYEKESLFNVLNRRQLLQSNDYKECPSCKLLVVLPETLYQVRVKCTNNLCKNASDFCWLCAKSWKGYGMTVCGNKDCQTASINEELQNCGTTNEIWGFEEINCPKKRACPRCLAITEHKDHCKHMVCWNCTREFCFICLALAEKGNGGKVWSCTTGNYYRSQCKLADVQILK